MRRECKTRRKSEESAGQKESERAQDEARFEKIITRQFKTRRRAQHNTTVKENTRPDEDDNRVQGDMSQNKAQG